jgi:hypothetical protein
MLVTQTKMVEILMLSEGVGKHSWIQLRTLLNKNNSVIECIFNVGASFYTTWEQRNKMHTWYKSKKVWTHDFEYNMMYKHRQQRWQSRHRKYIHLYNKGTDRIALKLNKPTLCTQYTKFLNRPNMPMNS